MRLEEAAEVTLACLLPGSRLTQCSHREELVEPAEKKMGPKVSQGPALHTAYQVKLPVKPETCVLIPELRQTPTAEYL